MGKRLCAHWRYVADFRHASDLPLGIASLQLRHLQLVPSADPLLARERVAKAEGIQHESGHTAILMLRLRCRQYDRLWSGEQSGPTPDDRFRPNIASPFRLP